MAVAWAAVIAGGPVLAADPSLRIEPAVTKVASGAAFTVRVVQDAPGPVSGVQASVLFDDAILRLESIAPGTLYADAPIMVPRDLPAAAASANETGHLAQVAAAFLPPASVPAGPAVFLELTFRAIGCGVTDIELPVGPRDAALIDGHPDTYGDPVGIAVAAGQVTTCVAAAEVTPVADGPAPGATGGRGMPAALFAAPAGLLIVAVAGGFAWRLRRRRLPE